MSPPICLCWFVIVIVVVCATGSYIGRVDAVQRMLAEVQADIAQHHSFHGADRFRLDDQRWFNRYYVRNHATFYPNPTRGQAGGGGGSDVVASVPIVAVDRVGSLFHTLHDVPLEAFRLQSYQLPPGEADGGGEAMSDGVSEADVSSTKMVESDFSSIAISDYSD